MKWKVENTWAAKDGLITFVLYVTKGIYTSKPIRTV